MSSTRLAKLAPFTPAPSSLAPAALVDELTVSPNSQARVRFTYGGGLAYYDAQGKLQSQPPGPKYQVTFAVSGTTSDQSARVFGQQCDWDVPCWPSMALTLGQTIAPEASPYFAPDLPRGWPCLQMTCVTEKGTGLLAVEAAHFAATVNMATMMTTPPQPDDQLVFFLMITDAKTTGKIVISTL